MSAHQQTAPCASSAAGVAVLPLKPSAELDDAQTRSRVLRQARLRHERARAQAAAPLPPDDAPAQVIAGAAAGALTKTSVAPIERLKVIFQTQGMRDGAAKYRSPLQSVRLILTEEGVRGLYKGNGANCLRVVPVYALKFSLNDTFTEAAARAQAQANGAPSGAPLPPLGFWTKIGAGSAAGVIQITLTYPLDLVRTRLQLAEAAGASYRGIAHCLRDTYTREGATALYKGLLPSMAAGVPYVGLQMTFYSELKAALGPHLPTRPDGSPTVLSMLVCGSLAGISAQTICYPLDTVRHRMQANGIGGQARCAVAGAAACTRMVRHTHNAPFAEYMPTRGTVW